MSQLNQASLYGSIFMFACLMPFFGRRKSYVALKRWVQFSMFLSGAGIAGFIAMLFNTSFSLSFYISVVAGCMHWCSYRLNIRHIIC